MSPFDDPQPPAPQQDAFDAEMMPAGSAPMSIMAVVGFVSSLMVCCPVLSPLLGLIFSLVGLSQTKGGVRRGRGLAIAGLIISIVVIPLQGLGIPMVTERVMGLVRIGIASNAFQAGDIDAGIAAWYDLASPDLKSAVTEDEFEAWINAEFKKHGGLQSLQLSPNQTGSPSPDGGRAQIQWRAQFPSETIDVYTDISVGSWGRMFLENVTIGEAQLIETKDSQPDSDAGDEPTDKKTTGDEPTEDKDTDEDG
ncbi:MAG: DUF4190 domain-containing protein [Planctomycetota bacterium]|nr:DUF4190 domain-containing protein [Planctomycetota bacterium]